MADSSRAAAQSKSTAAAPPRPKRTSAAANVKKEQPAKRPIVKQEPKDVVGEDKEKEDAKVSALI